MLFQLAQLVLVQILVLLVVLQIHALAVKMDFLVTALLSLILALIPVLSVELQLLVVYVLFLEKLQRLVAILLIKPVHMVWEALTVAQHVPKQIV